MGGKKGAVINDIEHTSWAKIQVDNIEGDREYNWLHITGTLEAVDHAVSKIRDVLERQSWNAYPRRDTKPPWKSDNWHGQKQAHHWQGQEQDHQEQEPHQDVQEQGEVKGVKRKAWEPDSEWSEVL